MTDRLKIGNRTPDRIVFDKAVYVPEYNFNFAQDWIINPEQSAGVSLEDNKIIIRKVKPNVWFLRSSFGYSTDDERNAMFYNKQFSVSGLAAARSEGNIVTVTNQPSGDGSQTYYVEGLVCSPCTDTGGLLSTAYPWEMGIPSGAFKKGVVGWNYYGFSTDGDIPLYDYNVSTKNIPWWGGTYWEVGFAFFTAKETGADGFLELTTPIILSPFDAGAFNPASVEGFKAYLGSTLVYEKEQTFENVLMKNGMAFKETGSYVEQVQGVTAEILDRDKTAYVVSSRKYIDEYPRLRFPVPTDLAYLIEKEFPMKFWATQLDIEGKPGFWKAVKDAFAQKEITNPMYCSYLFTKSNFQAGDDPLVLTINLGKEEEGESAPRFVLDHIFDWASIDKVKFVLKYGNLTTMVDSFRQTRNLTSLEFVNETGDEDSLGISQWAGAFEYSGLKDFPTGLGVSNLQLGHSETAAQISYAFHGSVLSKIGNLKSDSSRWNLRCLSYCECAFDGWSGTEILYDLDMKFVNPASGANRVFNCPSLVSAQIAGLNKGNWYLSGQEHGGVLHGNLRGLDNASVDYLLSNIFDLRRNAEEEEYAETSLNSFHAWESDELYFYTDHVELDKRLTNGTMTLENAPSGKLNLNFHISSGTFTAVIKNGSSSTTVEGGDNTTREIPVTAGKITMEITKSEGAVFTIWQVTHGKTEITKGLSAASIYLPSALQSKASQPALTEARNRGWTIVFE